MNILELLKEPCDKTAKKELNVFNILKNKNYFEKPEDSRPSHKALQSTFLLSIKRSQKETHLQEYLSPLFVHTGNTHTHTQKKYFKLKTLSLFDKIPYTFLLIKI